MVVHAALAWAGAPFRLTRVDTDAKAHKAPEFLAMNPMGQIPTLILPDGTVISETSAMILLIDEAFPQAGILPPRGTSERAKALRWLMFLAAAVYPAELRASYPERYTASADAAALAAVKQSGVEETDRELRMFADAIDGPCLLGSTLTITDVYAQMLIDWHDPGRALSPKFTPHYRAMMEHKAVAAAWKEHGFA